MSNLLKLPTELLTDILRKLPFGDILKCKRICRRIHGIINNDTRLQYQVRLALNGMVDNPTCVLPTSERYKRLVAYENAWKSPRLRDPYELNLGGNAACELARNVLAQARDGRTILFAQLPSYIQQTKEKRWEISDIGYVIEDFGMDPDQDLLVVGESQPTKYVLHVSTLTGDNHPLACDTGLLNWVTHAQMGHPKIKIAGDYVGIGFDPPMVIFPCDLVVWNWKTGQIHLALKGFFLSVFSFLTLDRIIVLEIEELRPTGLRIVSFSSPSPEIKNLDEASYDCCFSLPELTDDDEETLLEHIELRSEPSPFPSPGINSTTPFHVDTDKRILALTFVTNSLSDDDRHNRTFLISGEHITERSKSIRPDEGRRIGWDDWGPPACSILIDMEGYNKTWVCNVYGTRLMNRSFASGPYVLDCNKFASQRAPVLPVNVGAWSLRRKEEARNGGWFSKDLSVASLPVLRHKPLPMGTMKEYEATMLNDENVIIVMDSQWSTTQYHVASLQSAG